MWRPARVLQTVVQRQEKGPRAQQAGTNLQPTCVAWASRHHGGWPPQSSAQGQNQSISRRVVGRHGPRRAVEVAWVEAGSEANSARPSRDMPETRGGGPALSQCSLRNERVTKVDKPSPAKFHRNPGIKAGEGRRLQNIYVGTTLPLPDEEGAPAKSEGKVCSNEPLKALVRERPSNLSPPFQSGTILTRGPRKPGMQKATGRPDPFQPSSL